MTISQKWINNAAQAFSMPLSAIARPLPVNCADWADANFYMSPESSYAEGPWKCLPYQRAPLNMMGNDEIRELDFLKSARVGYSKLLMACMAYMVAQRRRNQIAYLPGDAAAASFMKEHVNPMIRDVRPVRDVCSWFGKKNHPSSTMTDKTFDHRRKLWVLGGNAAKNFREKSADTVFMDELDGFEEDVEGEGQPDHLARKRNEGSFFGKMICGSTPTVKHRSLIYRRSQKADVLLECHIPCPDCGHYQPLRFEQLILQDRQDVESVRHACESCGSMWTQAQAYAQQTDCLWRDAKTGITTRDGIEFTDSDGEVVPTPRHVALHLWSAYSPMTTWADIMRDFFARKGNPVELQTWWNQTLGKVWEKSGDVPPWKPLYDRSRGAGFERNKPHDWVALLTAGVDVQPDRLEVEIVGWGPGKRSQSIDYRVLAGDTSDLSAQGPWESLRKMVRDERWMHPSRASFSLACTAIDSGNQTQTVYTFCRDFQQPQVIPIKGSDTQATMVGIPSPVDVTIGGRKIRRGIKLWKLGVSLIKQEVYSFLKLDRPTEESGDPLPPGWCEFPEYGEDYFQGLCSEQLVRTKNKRGFTVTAWEKIRERNEPLDCRNYARAGAAVVGIDRWGEAEWRAQREALGFDKPPEDDATDTRHGVTFRKSDFWDR